jgi:tRNA-splicing ligase RtcB
VSERAFQRGRSQLGTLGSGNHYLEVQVVREGGVHDERAAQALGFKGEGSVAIMLHCGSRGLGHQVASDALREFAPAMRRHGLAAHDRSLACAPFRSPEGRRYHAAMCAAANVAFANRQLITHRVREVMERVFARSAYDLGLKVVYDVSHNTAKLERHRVDGEWRELLVHRKGATRAFGPWNPELPPIYLPWGQPVIVGGSMETGSAVLLGTERAMQETFGSTAHGAGRTMSRGQARRTVSGRALMDDMARRGIVVRAASMSGLAEEAGLAYKRLDEVVEALETVGLSRRVVSLRPIGNVKG